MAKVIDTDNYGGDYPDEKFIIPFSIPMAAAEQIAEILNIATQPQNRYYRAVGDGYVLKPGFEP